MTSRERVIKAMRRETTDRVPKFMELSPAQVEALKKHTGSDDAEDFFHLDARIVNPKPVTKIPDISRYLPDLPEGTRVDEWGIAWTQAGLYHFLGMVHPLKDVSTVAELEEYPFPDLAADEWFDGYAAAIQNAHDRGLAVVADCKPVGGTIFWPAYKMRGMEALLMDLVMAPDVAAYLLDKVTDICCDLARKLASFDVDVLWLADDYGTQRGLLVSRPMFQEWFKPRVKKVIEAARSVRPDILIAHHCDGAATEIVPDFIEVGVDILNPVQPECMDPVAIKREYGKDLSFWGTIGTQTTMPFGSPDDVRAEVRQMIETVGAGGGFLCAPTHVVEPEVPWENLVAFSEAVEEASR